MNRKTLFLTLIIILPTLLLCSQDANPGNDSAYEDWAVRMTNSFMERHPDHKIYYPKEGKGHRWHYEQGLMLEALSRMWKFTGNGKYLNFIEKNINLLVDDSGNIRTYDYEDFNLDNIAPGRALLLLYKETGKQKYKKAADLLRKQLENQPRTNEGGFWHKKRYPYQMWLDGLYMAEPFYAEYALMFDEPDAFEDITNQFLYIEKHTRDPETGLYYHGWDESRQQEWADPETGLSKSFWARAMGWYAMALVDVLDYIPTDHSNRQKLITILQELSTSLLKYRDPESKVWWQVVDQPDHEGNYLEASASCMYVYSFTKGVNRGYLDSPFMEAARESFQGILENFIEEEESGLLNIHHTCSSAGLGGKDKRDGSFGYYISEPQRTNDFKAIGPFIMSALQLEKGDK